jgi:CheY-like chemotaxis protein/PAS domain-containing protein
MNTSVSSLPMVLVVEDDKGIQELLRFTLVCGGYQPVCADTAEEAETLLRETLPDIALIDWMLPGKSGLALIGKLRNERRTRSMPIILLTARGEEADRVAGLEGGADDYIVKPFSPKELLARVQAVLRRCAPRVCQGHAECWSDRAGHGQPRSARYGPADHPDPDRIPAAAFPDGQCRTRLHAPATARQRLGRSRLYRRPHGRHPHPALRVALGPAAEQMVETVRGDRLQAQHLAGIPPLGRMRAAGSGFSKILLTGVLPIVGLALLLGVIHGAAWGWAVAALGLLLIVLMQTRRLTILAAWLDAPEHARVPDAGGAWGEVFVKLSRRLHHDACRVEEVEAGLRSFREAMDAVPDGLVILDASHQIQWSNRAAGEHLGIQPAARWRRDHRATGAHSGLRRLPRQPRRPQLPSSSSRRRRAAASMPSGPSLWGSTSSLLVSLDVTDARRVEAMRSTFVANVSHELRTPLTVVSGFLEHFTDDGAMSAEQRLHFARIMSDQTKRMLSLVDDLLTLSRLEAEDAPASEEECRHGRTAGAVAVRSAEPQRRPAWPRSSLRWSGLAGKPQGIAQRFRQSGFQRHSLHAGRRRDSHRMGNPRSGRRLFRA